METSQTRFNLPGPESLVISQSARSLTIIAWSADSPWNLIQHLSLFIFPSVGILRNSWDNSWKIPGFTCGSLSCAWLWLYLKLTCLIFDSITLHDYMSFTYCIRVIAFVKWIIQFVLWKTMQDPGGNVFYQLLTCISKLLRKKVLSIR